MSIKIIPPSLNAIRSLIVQNKRIFLTDTVIMVIANVLVAVQPIVMGALIGVVASGQNYEQIGWLGFIFVLLGAVHAVFWNIIGDNYHIHKVLPLVYKFRNICFEQAWSYEYKDYVTKPSSKIAASVNKIYEVFDQLYEQYHFNFISITTAYLVFIATSFSLIWQNAVTYVLFILIMGYILVKRLKLIDKENQIFADEYATANGVTFDSYSNYTNVLSFGAKSKEVVSYRKRIAGLTKARIRAGKAMVNFWIMAAIGVRWILWTIILVTNIVLLKRGDISVTNFTISLTILVAFTSLYWEFAWMIQESTRKFATYKQNYSYLFGNDDIVASFYDQEKAIQKNRPPLFSKKIELRNLSFAYPDRLDEDVLKDLNLAINKNEKIGIVGKSGGGKSTLVKLLLGFYDFNKGGVVIDGKSVSKEELSLLNAYVPQDTSLFQQSIRYNIAYASPGEVADDEVVEAAENAHAHDFIMNLKDGYDTLVGERGIKLSLGQRQRIAIARAFLKDSELLILDEATSSLDSKTEADIQQALEKLWQNKTVIAIAHRLSTLNNVDRIIVIDDGKIVEQGTKEQLLQAKGKFAELWKQQKDGLI
ncbi:ABC transporter ATP-binding protein [Candidatus Saccharibacteria bacterium]|nr:ABC transporter ATP-binding protein [Candidatus Saccharibacteria bacterium]